MPYTILLVDDDPDFRREFREYFSDYRIVEAGDGAEALARLGRPHEIDLVILDVRLPDQRGTEVLKKIKETVQGLPVVMLTGYGTKDVVIEALKGAADDYLEKPLDPGKAEKIIARIVSASPWRSPPASDGPNGKIARVKHFLERNVHKLVPLEEAAALVCVSPKYLSRLFRRVTGKGFSDFKLALKIAQAEKWLRETESNVNRIAYSLGYQNAESFIRIFHAATGRTPTQYRKGSPSPLKKSTPPSAARSRLPPPKTIRPKKPVLRPPLRRGR